MADIVIRLKADASNAESAINRILRQLDRAQKEAGKTRTTLSNLVTTSGPPRDPHGRFVRGAGGGGGGGGRRRRGAAGGGGDDEGPSRGAIDNAKALNRELTKATTIGGVLANIITAIAEKLFEIAYKTMRALINGFEALVAHGLEFNSSMEQSQVGIAAILTGQGEIIDQTGKALEGMEKFNVANAKAGELMDELKRKAIEFALPIDELAEGFQTSLGPLRAAGLELDQALDVSVKIALAMRALKVPLREQQQETRAILAGTATRLDRVNQILRISKEEVDAARQQGKLYELLNEELQGFAVAGARLATTYSQLFDNVRSSIRFLAGDMTKGLFEDIKVAAQIFIAGILDLLKRTSDGARSGLVATGQEIFARIGAGVKLLARDIIGGLNTISSWLSRNQRQVNALIGSFALLARVIYNIVKGLIQALGQLVAIGVETNAFAETIRFVAEVLFLLQLGFKTILLTIQSVGAAFMAGLLIPAGRLNILIGKTAEALGLGFGKKIREAGEEMVNTATGDLDAIKGRWQDLAQEIEDFKAALKGMEGPAFKEGEGTGIDTSLFKFLGETDEDLEKDKNKRKRFRDAELAAELAWLRLQEVMLKNSFDRREITIEEYYDRRAEIIKRRTEAEIRSLERQIAASEDAEEQAFLRGEIIAKQIDLERELIELQIEQQDTITNTMRERHNLQTQLLRETGELEEAHLRELEEQYREFIERAIQIGDDAGIEIANKLIDIELLKGRMERVLQEVSRGAAKLQDDLKSVQDRLELRQIGPKQAREETDALIVARQTQLQRTIEMMEEANKVFKSEEIQEQIRQLKVEVIELGVEAQKAKDIFLGLREALEGELAEGFNQFFEEFIGRTQSVTQAFGSMVKSIINGLARVVREMLLAAAAKKLMDEVFSTSALVSKSSFASALATASQIGMASGFAGGVTRISGPGTPTSDSILARLSRDESVLPAKVGHMYGYDLVEALIGLRARPDMLRAAAGLPGFAHGVSRITERHTETTDMGRAVIMVEAGPGSVAQILEGPVGERWFLQMVNKNPRVLSKTVSGRRGR